MRLILLTILTMIAFAANSVLNRMAFVDGGTGPAAFALVRLASGAIFLIVLASFQNGVVWRARNRLWGAATLALYVLGFSFAYVSLEAGIGALILFGSVQITMFIGAVASREKVPMPRWIGAGIAFAGLVVLLAPVGGLAPDIGGVSLMVTAAVGWGVYSLLGRNESNPLGATAANFVWALPAGVLVFLVLPDGMTWRGSFLAVASGAFTSGAGYALWYSILPRLGASVAAVAQLSVPLIAVAGGLVVLGEPVTLRFGVAAILVLSGIVVSLKKN